MAWNPGKTIASADNSVEASGKVIHKGTVEDIKSGNTNNAGNIGKEAVNIASMGYAHEAGNAGGAAKNSTGKGYHSTVVNPMKDAIERLKKSAENAAYGGAKPGGGGGGGVQAPQLPLGFQGGRLSPNDIALGGPQGAIISPASGDGFRTYQSNLAEQLAQRASGKGQMISDLALRQAQDQNQAQAFAQLASARGGANPMLARNTMNTSSNLAAQTARDSTMAKLAEMQGAQQQLGQVAAAGRGQDLELATNQARLNQEASIVGYQGGIDQMKMQANLAQQYQELVGKYAAMGLDAQKANQMAGIEVEKIRQNYILGKQQNDNALKGGLMSTAGTIIGAYFGGPAGAKAGGEAGQGVQNGVDKNASSNTYSSNSGYDEGMNDPYNYNSEGNIAGGGGQNGMK